MRKQSIFPKAKNRPKLSADQWESVLSSALSRGSSADCLENQIMRLQKKVRDHLMRQRLQRNLVSRKVAQRLIDRNLSEEHIVDERPLTLADLSRMTLDSASSAFNAYQPVKKAALMRSLGGAVQLLLGVVEGIGTLAGHATLPGFIHAVHMMLSDLFNATAVYVVRVVDQSGPGSAKWFEVGTECKVPPSSIPLAARVLNTPVGSPPTLTSLGAPELKEMRIVSWIEPDAASAYGKPEMLCAAGNGEEALMSALDNLRRVGRASRQADKVDAAHMAAVHIGDAVVMFSRTDGGGGPLSSDEAFAFGRLALPMGNALQEVEARVGLREVRQRKAALAASVTHMASGYKAIEADARALLSADDGILYTVKVRPDGRPQLMPATRNMRDDEHEGVYEHVEHLWHKEKAFVNVRQGGVGAIDRILEMLPSPLRCQHRSMLCVPVIVPPGSVSALPEGIVAVMQWRNHALGGFSRADVKLAAEWAAIASPAFQLAGTNAQRLLLEERVKQATAKRDALMATAKILGSTREVEELFSAIMVHAKTLMEVERTTMFLVNKPGESLYTMVADGLGEMGEINIPWDKGLAGACFTTKQVVSIRDAYEDERFNKDVDKRSGFRTKSVLCYPVLNAADEVIGVIQLINKETGLGFTEQDEDLVCGARAPHSERSYPRRPLSCDDVLLRAYVCHLHSICGSDWHVY